MKKLIAMILSVLLLCGSVTPALAAESEPDRPELVAAEIVSVPLKNRIVFSGGNPASPDGIEVKLTYSDGTTVRTVVQATEAGWFAGDEAVDPGGYIQVIRYGVFKAGLWFSDGAINAEYRYLSLPNPLRGGLEFFMIRLFWLRERLIASFDQLFQSA